MIKRSEILLLFGITTLLISVFAPNGMIAHEGNILIYSIIFITGSIITSAVESKK